MRQRKIWLLKHRRAGDLAQMRHLAFLLRGTDAASWTVEEKQLVFRQPGIAAFPPAAHFLLDGARSDRLAPPWPDAILVAEASAARIARSLKAEAGAGTKIIVLGRPAGATTPFDLVLTTAQYGLPAAPNVIHLPLPLAALPSASPESRQAVLQCMAGKPRPWLAVLIGGSVAPDHLSEDAVAQIAEAARGRARDSGGSLIVVTSPRTGEAREAVIRKLLSEADLLHLWAEASAANLYGAVLAEADSFLVTSDSISMTAEALSTGKPVSVFTLPQRAPMTQKLVLALSRSAGIAVGSPRQAWRWATPLFTKGILEAPADRPQFYRELIRRGVLAVHPGWPTRPVAEVTEEANMTALQAVRKLLA